jgi:hypothetical protein
MAADGWPGDPACPQGACLLLELTPTGASGLREVDVQARSASAASGNSQR